MLQALAHWNREKLYSDLANVKQKYKNAKHPLTLSAIEKDWLDRLLCGYSPDQIAEQLHREPKGLRVDLSRTIYKYVKILSGRNEKQRIDDWRDISKWLSEAGYKKRQDWGEALDISVFYGRTEELAKLKTWIVKEKCRLVLLFGMIGMGKTTLALKLAQEISGEFDYFIWRSLNHAPSFPSFISDLEIFFSDKPKTDTTDSEKNHHDSISSVKSHLQNHRCLVVLDGWNGILPSNVADYEAYSQFWQWIGQPLHQSCFLLIGEQKPSEMAFLEGEKVRSLQLGSLGEATKQIFLEKNLSNPEDWDTLIQRYGGNPLVLKLIGERIKDLFFGRVTQFLDQGTECGVIVPEVIRRLLHKQFKNLPELEYQVICSLANYRQPASLKNLGQLNPDLRNSTLMEALSSLKGRSLLEVINQGGESYFTVQPLVMKYVIQEENYSS